MTEPSIEHMEESAQLGDAPVGLNVTTLFTCAHCHESADRATSKRCGVCGHFVHQTCAHVSIGQPQVAAADARTTGRTVVDAVSTLPYDRSERYTVMVQIDDRMLQDHYTVMYQCAYCTSKFEVKYAFVLHLITCHPGDIGMRVKEGTIPFAAEDAENVQ